ncbi:hypothetical protein A1D31_38550 [Bradyrhizobium liaoningense]|nr:hypothetical protein A1D31_38550 [Bradyrhizobium liaoningense]
MTSDFIALAQTVLATNAHNVAAASVAQLAAIGFESMRNSQELRVIGQMELDRLAARRAQAK